MKNISKKLFVILFTISSYSLFAGESVTIKHEKDNHAICQLLKTTYDSKTDMCVGVTGCQWDLARAEYSLQQKDLHPQSKKALLHAKKAIKDAKASCQCSPQNVKIQKGWNDRHNPYSSKYKAP